MSTVEQSRPSSVLFPVCVAALGGFLFGYDTAVISGAIGYLQTHFHLDDVQKGLAASSALIGCIPGAMFSGSLSDRFGRKNVLLLCALLYTLSGILSAFPPSFGGFLLARSLGGLAIGACSMVCPVYIAEIAPPEKRGRLGSLFQFGVVLGIFLVFFVNWLIQSSGTEDWNLNVGWRWMLGSEAFPAGLFLLLLLAVPESPRWLATRGVKDRSREAKVPLLSARYARPLAIAIGLMAFSQLSGINAVMYYAPEIFKTSGDATNAAFQSSVYIGLINLLFTLVATATVDGVGRRKLLLIGIAVQTMALIAVGAMFQAKVGGLPLLGSLLVFIAAFAMSLGPIPWIVCSEIFDDAARGRAMSVSTFVIWTGATAVAQLFPIMNARLGAAVTFWTFGVFSLLSLIFVLTLVPETKGRSLDEQVIA